MGKQTLSALRVIDRAAGEVPTNGNTNDSGTGESTIRAPANDRQFVAHLMEGWPDIVEELNFDDRLQASRGDASRAPDDRRFCKRRVVDTLRAEFALQARSQFEDTALAFDQLLAQVLLTAAIGNIFAEHHDALIALHLIAQAGIDEVGHGFIAARALGLSCKLG